MAYRLSSSERHALERLRGELHALDEDIASARVAARRTEKLMASDAALQKPPPPRLDGERVCLPGGQEIQVRPVEPGDEPQLEFGLEHLSAMSRYRRFLTRIDHFTPHQLERFTHVDHRTEELLVALDPVGCEGVGVAHFALDRKDPRTAELDYVVADAWHRRGVGGALVERIAARAAAAGVEIVTATMLIGSEVARRLLERVADVIREETDGGVVILTARLRGARPARP